MSHTRRNTGPAAILSGHVRRLPPWILTAVCGAAILWLTLVPRPLPDSDIPLFPGADKVAHAIMFGALALCIETDRCRRGHRWHPPTAGLWLTAAAISSLTGIAIEWAQRAMDLGRSFETADMAADAAGAFLVALAIFPIYRTCLKR